MALTYSFIGYREPEADENSAPAQAYEYLLARLTWLCSIISCKLRKWAYYEITSFTVQIYDYCMVY